MNGSLTGVVVDSLIFDAPWARCTSSMRTLRAMAPNSMPWAWKMSGVASVVCRKRLPPRSVPGYLFRPAKARPGATARGWRPAKGLRHWERRALRIDRQRRQGQRISNGA